MKKTFIIGDIHGCYDELTELTQMMELKDEDILVSVGDIVDRGNKSKEVYQYFRDRPNSIVLIGNHERKHLNAVLNYAQEIVKVQMGEEYADLLKWLKTLPYYYETEEAIIVHAAFENGKELKEQKEEVLCGSTAGERYLEKLYGEGTYWNEYYTGKKSVIYGHHVVGDEVKVFNNTYGIDTGCCHGGFLTAIELPGFIIHQVKAKKDYWKEEQKLWQVPVLKAKDWKNMEFEMIHKQLEKLSYIEDAEVLDYLNSLKKWIGELEKMQEVLLNKLKEFTQELLFMYKDNFSVEAGKFEFKTFLFKSKAGNLKLEDIQKSLNTPQKVIDLSWKLGVRSYE